MKVSIKSDKTYKKGEKNLASIVTLTGTDNPDYSP